MEKNPQKHHQYNEPKASHKKFRRNEEWYDDTCDVKYGESTAGCSHGDGSDSGDGSGSILGNVTFDMLNDKVSPQTLQAVKDIGFTHLTDIQSKSIPHLLLGRDVNGAAKTGSGKTLAFLIPAIELLLKHDFKAENGTGCIVLSPTRELAQQTDTVLSKLLKYHSLSYGLIIGGKKKEEDCIRIRSGLNIIVATPGRLLDHLQNLEGFLFSNLKMLVIDEADRLLDMGFEVQIKLIVSILPKLRQTVLFSATPTTKTQDLARISFRNPPVYVGVDDEKKSATVQGLEQGYVICPSDKRFLLLFSFLKKNRDKKIMVFFNTYKSVKFYEIILNKIEIPVMAIFGKMKQNKRSNIFSKFVAAAQGTMLCTDVASRGLDIPAVDWIVQYDPPENHTEYIHRVGRTARGEGGTGQALIFLLPSEKEFIFVLKRAKVTVSEFDFAWDEMVDITPMIIKMVASSPDIMKVAKSAFKGYFKGYKTYSLKSVFNINNLDQLKIGLSYGLTDPTLFKLKK